MNAFGTCEDKVVVLAGVLVFFTGGVKSKHKILLVSIPLILGLLPSQVA